MVTAQVYDQGARLRSFAILARAHVELAATAAAAAATDA
jgi:hypothetical protein